MSRVARESAVATEPRDLTLELAPDTHASLDALREVGNENEASYRSTQVPRDRLWAAIEDPHTRAVTRARAAVALSSQLSSDERVRLRVAAESTMSPKVRVVLDAIDKDDEKRLAKTLAALDEEEVEAENEKPRLRA